MGLGLSRMGRIGAWGSGGLNRATTSTCQFSEREIYMKLNFTFDFSIHELELGKVEFYSNLLVSLHSFMNIGMRPIVFRLHL